MNDTFIRVVASERPYGYEVSGGNIAGHTTWLKIGFNAAVGATAEVIAPQGGAYAFPAAEAHMHIVSSDAADKGTAEAGTGIRTATVHYLNSAGAEKSETVTLNGDTIVETDATDIYRIQDFRAVTTGTSLAAVGTITIKNHANAVTYASMAIGDTSLRQAVWTVPAGKTLYVSDIEVGCVADAANKYCTVSLKSSYDSYTATVLSAGVIVPYSDISLESGVSNLHLFAPLKFPATSDIVVTGVSNSSAVTQVVLRGWTE